MVPEKTHALNQIRWIHCLRGPLHIRDTGKLVEKEVELSAVHSTAHGISFGCPRQDPLGGRPYHDRGLVRELVDAVANLLKYRSLRHPLDNRQGD